MLDTRTLKHFGLQQRGWFRSQLHDVYEEEIATAVAENHLLAVVGEFGAGKSQLVEGALRRISRRTADLDIVWVTDPNRERQTISTIMNAAIYDLAASGENPRRDSEARARQFARIVGERVIRQKRRVTIIIENAHRLHSATLMAIKDSRESARFADHVGALFSVILVGQGRLKEIIEKQPEIHYRSTILDLTEEAGWMVYQERVRYLDSVYNGAIAADTQHRLAELYHTPLALDHAVEDAMRQARAAGFDMVDDRVITLSMQELRDLLQPNLSDVARISGVPKSTVYDALNRGDDHPSAPAVRQALEQIRNNERTARAA